MKQRAVEQPTLMEATQVYQINTVFAEQFSLRLLDLLIKNPGAQNVSYDLFEKIRQQLRLTYNLPISATDQSTTSAQSPKLPETSQPIYPAQTTATSQLKASDISSELSVVDPTVSEQYRTLVLPETFLSIDPNTSTSPATYNQEVTDQDLPVPLMTQSQPNAAFASSELLATDPALSSQYRTVQETAALAISTENLLALWQTALKLDGEERVKTGCCGLFHKTERETLPQKVVSDAISYIAQTATYLSYPASWQKLELSPYTILEQKINYSCSLWLQNMDQTLVQKFSSSFATSLYSLIMDESNHASLSVKLNTSFELALKTLQIPDQTNDDIQKLNTIKHAMLLGLRQSLLSCRLFGNFDLEAIERELMKFLDVESVAQATEIIHPNLIQLASSSFNKDIDHDEQWAVVKTKFNILTQIGSHIMQLNPSAEKEKLKQYFDIVKFIFTNTPNDFDSLKLAYEKTHDWLESFLRKENSRLEEENPIYKTFFEQFKNWFDKEINTLIDSGKIKAESPEFESETVFPQVV